MNRKEIKSIAKSKLKGRWFNIVLLTLIIAIIEFGASEIIGRTEGITSNILNIANNFLLMPAITASGIIYTIKFVKSNEVVSLSYAIPSVKTWGRFIMSMIVTMIFSIPILLVVFLGNIFLKITIVSQGNSTTIIARIDDITTPGNPINWTNTTLLIILNKTEI